jgi:anti-anti-sigma regulatory factor
MGLLEGTYIVSACSETVVALSGALGLKDAGLTGERLHEALLEHERVKVEVHDLANFNIGIIQILVSARRTARQLGRELVLSETPSSAFQTTLIQAGLLAPDGTARTEDEQFWMNAAARLEEVA